MSSKLKKTNKLMEINKQERRSPKKRTVDSDAIMPVSKIKKLANELPVKPKSNASFLSETEPGYISCPKCFYKCKNPKKYENHSCNKILSNMKSCVVVLNIFPGLDINTRGNYLFFQCCQCSRFFIDGYSYSQHLSTHPETQFNRSIKTISLNINRSYSTPTIDDDPLLMDANANITNNTSNVTSVKPDESTIASNIQKKMHKFCCIS